jgi:radical SAM superfamily enzyme with C-terminal helix-hairpin-helix motif
VLDSFSRNRGNHREIYTRFQTECANPGKIQFLIKRKNIFNKKAPKGTELLLTEMEVFDRKYRLFGSNKRDIKRLLDRKILANIVEQKPFSNIRIELKEQNLELHIRSLNKDLVQLKSLFHLIEDLRSQIDIEF